eukprot:m.720237 g.720237  ORF g.720237 m.720237 type:complete len:61 (+) comp23003_c0_seq20:2478-2660(+)
MCVHENEMASMSVCTGAKKVVAVLRNDNGRINNTVLKTMPLCLATDATNTNLLPYRWHRQ